MIAAAPAGWRRLLVSLIAETGLRVSEALGLRWADLDLADRRLNVRQRALNGKVGPPKSARGRRIIPVSGPMARDRRTGCRRPRPTPKLVMSPKPSALRGAASARARAATRPSPISRPRAEDRLVAARALTAPRHLGASGL